MPVDRRHLALVTRYTLRNSLRGGTGLVFLLLGVLFSLFVANAVITPVEQLVRQAEKAGVDAEPAEVVDKIVAVGRPVVEWALDEKTGEWTRFLLVERPALLSAIFLIMLFGLPFLIPLGAFNQTAGDIGSRGIRYLLLRTERSNIFFGRFLATAIFTAVVLVVSIALIAIYVALKLDIYAAGDVVRWSLRGAFAVAVLSLPYVALCSWISAHNDSALLSLVVASLAVGAVLLLAFAGSRSVDALGYIRWLLPWGVQNQLLAPGLGRVALATLACFGYTAAYLYLGHRHFARRDL